MVHMSRSCQKRFVQDRLAPTSLLSADAHVEFSAEMSTQAEDLPLYLNAFSWLNLFVQKNFVPLPRLVCIRGTHGLGNDSLCTVLKAVLFFFTESTV